MSENNNKNDLIGTFVSNEEEKDPKISKLKKNRNIMIIVFNICFAIFSFLTVFNVDENKASLFNLIDKFYTNVDNYGNTYFPSDPIVSGLFIFLFIIYILIALNAIFQLLVSLKAIYKKEELKDYNLQMVVLVVLLVLAGTIGGQVSDLSIFILPLIAYWLADEILKLIIHKEDKFVFTLYIIGSFFLFAAIIGLSEAVVLSLNTKEYPITFGMVQMLALKSDYSFLNYGAYAVGLISLLVTAISGICFKKYRFSAMISAFSGIVFIVLTIFINCIPTTSDIDIPSLAYLYVSIASLISFGFFLFISIKLKKVNKLD